MLLFAFTACVTKEVTQTPSPTFLAPKKLIEVEIAGTRLRQAIAVTQPATATLADTRQPLSPTPEHFITAANSSLIGPENFPENVNPLTGTTVSDPADLQRRPIAIKISNIAKVRPQAGLSKADLVFEHYSEAGITRFTAIFYTNDVERIGSVRSGRLIDLEIPLMYDAAFAYSGSSYQIREMIRGSAFFDRVISPDFAHSGFERINDDLNPSDSYVDSMFTNTYTLRWILEQREQNTAPVFQNGMAFQEQPPAGGAPIGKIEIAYKSTNIHWEYQRAAGHYARWSDGESHLDANTGERLSFKNIVIIEAPHLNTEIPEDSGGTPSIQIQLWGEGPAKLFRDGLEFEGIWRRESTDDMLSFYDLSGRLLPLAPGNTFFQIVPLGFSDLEVQP